MKWLNTTAAYLLLLAGTSTAVAQRATPPQVPAYSFTRTGQVYVHWGYNRAWYTKSDIHFQGPGYGFTIEGARASDRPSEARLGTYLAPGTLTTPQFNVRAGVFLSPRVSVSIGYDHMKYVLNANQTVPVTGAIAPLASSTYDGFYDRTPVQLAPDFLAYEHTNGLNLITAEVEWHQTLWALPNGQLGLHAVGSAGAGPVLLRTDAHVLQRGDDTDYHIGGFGGSAQGAVRLYFLRHFYAQAAGKVGYITLPDVTTDNTANCRAQHHFGFWEPYLVFGAQFGVFNTQR